MNLFSEDDEKSLPEQDANSLHIHQIRVSYSETSLEITRSDGGKTSLIEVWTAMGKVQLALGQTDEVDSSFQEAEQLK